MDRSELLEILKTEGSAIIAAAVEERMRVAEEKLAKSQQVSSPPWARPLKAFSGNKLAEKDPAEMSSEEKALMAGRCVRYFWLARGNPMAMYDFAKANNDRCIANSLEKALATDVFASGGALIPPEFTSGIIDLLYAQSVIRQSGVDVWPMNTGSLTAPFLDTGATAAYVGAEGDNITKSEQTTGQLQFHDKKLAALVPMSNDMLRNGGPQVDRVLSNNIVRQLRLKEDITMIRSDGDQGEPKGLLYWATDGGTVFAANATFNAANVAADLARSLRELEDNNVPLDGAVWIMAPRTKWALASLQDGNSNYIYRDEIANGKLLGYPLYSTTQIPTNLGSGTDESEIYCYAAPLCVIAENEFLLLEMFDNAAYYDGSAVQSGVSRDESVVRAIALHDFGCQHRGQEVVVIDTCKWGS